MAYWIGMVIVGYPICALMEPSSNSTMDWMTLCGIAFVLGAIVLLNLPVRSKPVQTELSKSIPDQEKEENHD